MKTPGWPHHRALCSAAMVIGFLTGLAAPCFAATLTWNGGYSTTGSWQNAKNWGGTAWSNAQDVVFGSTNLNNITNTFLSGGKTVKSLTFQAGSKPYNIRLATTGSGGTGSNLNFISTNTGLTVEAGDTSSHHIGVSDGVIVLYKTLLVAHHGTGTLTFSRPVIGTGYGVTKTGDGRLAFSSANRYTGATTISGGTLALEASNTIADASAMSIGAATLAVGNGFTDNLGALDVTGTATIHLGGFSSALAFADSRGINGGTWDGTLHLTGAFVSGSSLRFGSDSGGLTAEQLARISADGFSDFGLSPTGFLTAEGFTPASLYTDTGSPANPPWSEILPTLNVQANDPGPVYGSVIDVNNAAVEAGLYGNRPISVPSQRIHVACHTSTTNFANFTRWFQTDGNTQVLRVFVNDENTATTRPGPSSHTEAFMAGGWNYTNDRTYEWTGRYTFARLEQGVVCFQLKNSDNDWAFQLVMGSDGTLKVNNRRSDDVIVTDPDGSTRDFTGRGFDLRVLDDGHNYEVWIDGVRFTRSSYSRPTGTTTFRWGMYFGANKLNPPAQYNLVLVSGPQIQSWSGKLASTPPGYTTWAHFHAGGQDSGSDFDGDGVANAIEYVLGGNATTNDLAKLPAATITGDRVVFTFIRDQASIDGATTVDIQTSDNLLGWPVSHPVPGAAMANNPGVTVLKDVPASGWDTVTLSLPLSGSPSFSRLRVTP